MATRQPQDDSPPKQAMQQTSSSIDFDYLSPSNPILLRMIKKYGALDYFDHSMWGTWRDRLDLRNFRREGDYLAQLDYGMSEQKYFATLGYVAAQDDEDYLHRFPEDDLFGVIPFRIGELVVTRDLLDSILEINFLRDCLQIGPLKAINVIDIGAGYGRFAYRFTTAFPKGRVTCMDGVPESSFVCEYYIKFRGFEDRAQAVPLYSIKEARRPYDIAVNIHSWSECTLRAINFWLDLIADLNIPYIFVVPHTSEFLTREKDGSTGCFLPAIKAHGYVPWRSRPKYGSPVMQEHGLYPAMYYLFRQSPNA